MTQLYPHITDQITDQDNSNGQYQLTIADLPSAFGLTDQYDNLLLRLCDSQTHSGSLTAISDVNTRFCHHARHALSADTVYVCDRSTLKITATSSTTSPVDLCADTADLHNALSTMVSDLGNCESSVCVPQVSVFPDSGKFSFFITPLTPNPELLLVAVDAETEESLMSQYLSAALSGLYLTLQAENLPTRAACESQIIDYLHDQFQNSSGKIANLRLNNFKQEIKASTVSFNGITHNGNTQSDDNNQPQPGTLYSQLPNALYATAKRWGTEFKTALDLHCLVESSYGYKTLCEDEALLKFETSRALQIKVHACTLNNPEYIKTLTELAEKAVIHSSRLLFNLIFETSIDNEGTVLNSEQLRQLLAEPQAPAPVKTSKAKPANASIKVNINDEFDLLGTNGVRVPTPKLHSGNRLIKAAV